MKTSAHSLRVLRLWFSALQPRDALLGRPTHRRPRASWLSTPDLVLIAIATGVCAVLRTQRPASPGCFSRALKPGLSCSSEAAPLFARFPIYSNPRTSPIPVATSTTAYPCTGSRAG
jgi:hypothetical protein